MEYPEDKITFCKFIGGPSEHQIAYFAKALASAEIDKAAELLKIELQKSIKAFIEEQFPNDDTIHEISGYSTYSTVYIRCGQYKTSPFSGEHFIGHEFIINTKTEKAEHKTYECPNVESMKHFVDTGLV